MLLEAEAKADAKQDMHFGFGRYRGLGEEDYCGLKWCDLGLNEGVLHWNKYQWTAADGKVQKPDLKLKKKGGRNISMDSEVLRRLEE